jgi:predicted alpha/beta hydrolase
MQNIALHTSDAAHIGAVFYPAAGAQRIVLIAGATAVPQGFYRRFALALNVRGYHALSFDYRGIGLSKPTSLKGFQANFRDWGERDCAAAFDFAAQHGAVYLAGHSFGGHAIGMLPQGNQLKAAWACGVGAGYSGYMPFLERLKVELLWRVLAPIGSRVYGFGPMSKFGIGEDLPLGCYQDWKRWCGLPHYFFDDPALQGSAFLQRFAEIRVPLAFVNALDDLWAPAASRDAFIQGYRQAVLTRLDLQPANFSVKSIGHMGYFRQNMAPLWQQAADYFDQH